MTQASGAPAIAAPVALDAAHDLAAFDCGKAPLDDWLKNHALRNEGKSSRCFVACAGDAVAGYYCISAGAVAREAAPGKLKRNMPESVPVAIVGRLGVDRRHQGRGLGRALLKDALLRILAASREIGVRAVVIHAIDDEAVRFYAQYGFVPFPGEARTLFLPVESIAAAL